MTLREAAELWVNRDMTRIPLSVVEKLCIISDYNDITEITPAVKYSKVWSNEHQEIGEVVEIVENDEGDLIATVEFKSGERHEVQLEDLSVENEEGLPMWGTMWAFEDNCDSEWLDDEENLRKMAECGFRIYESEDYGYIFGINGAGYSFYDEHWIPLYKARGLRWHDEKEKEGFNYGKI